MTRVLVAEVPDWPVLAGGVSLDEPAAVFHANRVVACSPAARDEGVDVGLRRRESQARCPALVVLAHDPARDARAWEPVVAGLEDLCPRVEVAAPGRLAFPVRGPSRYFGGDDAVARLVVDRTGATVGVAEGSFAALLAARTGAGVVVPGGTPGFLAPLPVSSLLAAGFPIELVDVLGRLGLRTLGAVAAVPVGDLTGRFGPDGMHAHRIASGRDDRPPATRSPDADLTARIELDPPAERVETAAFLARGLADELSTRLDVRGLACTRLLIVAETEHGERLERLWRGDGAGGAAALSAGAIADRVRWQLDGWLRGSGGEGAPTAGITLLELVPDEAVAATGRQLGFWGGSPDAAARAVRAVARITGLLGVDAVVVPERRGGRGPADEYALVPAATVDLDDEGLAGP